jgi:drug/metabolite transporter (DMT)-like permease
MITSAPRKPLTGILLMLLAMAVLPFLDVVAKTLGQQGVPVMQIVWARMVFGAALTLPFALHHRGPRGLLPDRPLVHVLRAALLMGATFTFFAALLTLPIADALAIFFVNPLIVTALSPLLLGERVGPRRWAAVGAGFVGTLIIIRPGFQAITPGVMLALAAGICLALYLLMTRRMAGRTPAMVTTYDTSIMGVLIASAAMPMVWLPPSPAQWGLFLAIGLIATVGHYLIVRAYDYAEASLLAPFAYSEMVMAVVVGWAFFSDFPDTWTFVGVSILIASACYISVREQRLRKTVVVTASPSGLTA